MSIIAARATPAGYGGVGIVRISGSGSKAILDSIFQSSAPDFKGFQPWRLHHGIVRDKTGQPLDDVLAVFMPGPKTFTGEELVEIQCHGGPAIVESILECVLAKGARMAERGEFTRRAFLNGRLDLSQAEAVAEIIAAPARKSIALGFQRLSGAIAREAGKLAKQLDDIAQFVMLGIDFPEDEIEAPEYQKLVALLNEIIENLKKLIKAGDRARFLENGAAIVLAGPVNAGKSSLFNALCGQDRALVTDVPGTTRDFLEASLDIDGMPVRIIDTAGIREDAANPDYLESLGIAKTREQLAGADAVLFVLDGQSWRQYSEDEKNTIKSELGALAQEKPLLLVINKTDIAPDFCPDFLHGMPACRISALTGENIECIFNYLKNFAAADNVEFAELAPNRRQTLALTDACVELEYLQKELQANIPFDCIMARLDSARSHVNEILGLGASTEILDRIFADFCIGK